MDLITTTWDNPITGSTCFVWESELKEVKHSLKQWEKEHLCPPHLKKKLVKQNLIDICLALEKEEVTEDLIQKEKRPYVQAFPTK